MRQNLIFLFIAMTFYAHAQAPFDGVDSVKNIRWENDITMFFADVNGNDSVPSQYVRTEFDLTYYDRILVMDCDKKKYLGETSDMQVPKQFIYKIKTPANGAFSVATIGDAFVPDSILHPDSITMIDMKGLAQFYIDKKDSLKIDTLQVSEYKVFDFNEFFNYSDKVYECSYKYNLKNGTERSYYKISELKDVCITDNFRLKYEGHWKSGKKNGKWREYDRSGKLISVKKYKHDKLIKQKDF
jgi:hypothetical protein